MLHKCVIVKNYLCWGILKKWYGKPVSIYTDIGDNTEQCLKIRECNILYKPPTATCAEHPVYE